MTYKYTQNYPTERKNYPSKKAGKAKIPPLESPPAEEAERQYHPTEGNPEDGGKLSPADAERIASEDLPGPEERQEQEQKKAA